MCHCDGPEHPYDPSWCPPPKSPSHLIGPIFLDPRWFNGYGK
jgi:hypothetical protein